jgi:hypothetical protein
MSIVDQIVFYDDMQYTKRDWRNRNKIKTENGLKWLTIPVEVSGKYFQKINETKVADNKWSKSHLSIIKLNYKKSKYYDEIIDWLDPIYNEVGDYKFLTDINIHFIKKIVDFLEINIKIHQSSSFELLEDKNERLVDLCIKLNATNYYSGPAAKSYMDENLFNKNNIKVNYFDYLNYKEYNQLFPPFDHNVSILDLLFCCGKESKKYLKYT